MGYRRPQQTYEQKVLASSTEPDPCPDFLKPRLRLFLSADIVGSTALKQSPFDTHSKAEQRTKWFSKIQGFYFQAQQAFISQCRSHCSSVAVDFGPMPDLWKTIGDEVLFVKEITDHRQIIAAIRCWMLAIPEMRLFIKKENPRLDVKCTAWLAGFPLRNSEVVVSNRPEDISNTDGEWFVNSGEILERLYKNGPEADVKIDYIGPSIDIGFRLGPFSSSRKFIISVDVAYVLSIANPGIGDGDPVFSVYFDGSKPLKGVLGGVEYPIFWLDLSPEDSLVRAQDKISSIESVNRDRLREYCNKFFQTYDQYTFAPFIESQTEQQLNDKPDWYTLEHKQLVKSYELRKASTVEEEDAIADPDQDGVEVSTPPNTADMDRFIAALKVLAIKPPKGDGS